MARLTAKQMLQAQLNSIERRLEQLESWTGAEEDGNCDGSEASTEERLLALEAINMHLLRYLELLVPGFSIAFFREDMHAIDNGVRKLFLQQNPDSPISDTDLLKRSRDIIDCRLPRSLYDDGGQPAGPAPADFRSLLRSRTGGGDHRSE